MKKRYKIAVTVGLCLLFAVSLYFLIKSKYCKWNTGEWSSCKNGIQTRSVTCDPGCECTDKKPDISQSCGPLNPCEWNTGQWSECNPKTKTQTRSVTCDPGCECTGKKPDISQSCGPLNYSNIRIYSPGDKNIQEDIDNIFKTQGGLGENGQFSELNYALLFIPGTYNVDIPVGYYTQVAGLGDTPDQVIINGGPHVDNTSNEISPGALDNFWRSCENMTVNPTFQINGNKTMIWATSQACSLRSVNVIGDLQLAAMTPPSCKGNMCGMGYSSGGFLANCKVDGTLQMGSQQQFICRNSEWDNFPTALWNQVNVGCKGKTVDSMCKDITNSPGASMLTNIQQTPFIIEKPFLVYDKSSTTGLPLSIIYPNKNTNNSSGVTQNGGTKAKYFIIDPHTPVDVINQKLASKMDILITPGIYNIDKPIELNGQLLFGLGLPRLIASNNTDIVTGYGSICGVIFQAGQGANSNNTLVNLSGLSSYLWDVYCRVGGEKIDTGSKYSADTMLHIGGDGSMIDNTWCWSADHNGYSRKPGWDDVVCNVGVKVTGKNVICYGLFSEHNRLNVDWIGEGGSVYMFQSEFNYYPPNQQAFDQTPKVSYRANTVKNHLIRGAGAYSYFAIAPVFADAGFLFSNGVDYENIFTVFLNGQGGINHVLNTTGGKVSYPNRGGVDISSVCGRSDAAIYSM